MVNHLSQRSPLLMLMAPQLQLPTNGVTKRQTKPTREVSKLWESALMIQSMQPWEKNLWWSSWILWLDKSFSNLASLIKIFKLMISNLLQTVVLS